MWFSESKTGSDCRESVGRQKQAPNFIKMTASVLVWQQLIFSNQYTINRNFQTLYDWQLLKAWRLCTTQDNSYSQNTSSDYYSGPSWFFKLVSALCNKKKKKIRRYIHTCKIKSQSTRQLCYTYLGRATCAVFYMNSGPQNCTCTHGWLPVPAPIDNTV